MTFVCSVYKGKLVLYESVPSVHRPHMIIDLENKEITDNGGLANTLTSTERARLAFITERLIGPNYVKVKDLKLETHYIALDNGSLLYLVVKIKWHTFNVLELSRIPIATDGEVLFANANYIDNPFWDQKMPDEYDIYDVLLGMSDTDVATDWSHDLSHLLRDISLSKGIKKVYGLSVPSYSGEVTINLGGFVFKAVGSGPKQQSIIYNPPGKITFYFLGLNS